MNAPVDVTDIRIETERLILRAWRETDLADLYEYASVEGVGEMAGWNHHQSVEESRRILDSFISGKKTFALELKENGKVIGSLGLEPRDGDAGLAGRIAGTRDRLRPQQGLLGQGTDAGGGEGRDRLLLHRSCPLTT